MIKILRRALLAIAIASFGFVAMAPSQASAETMNWRVKSNYKYKVQIAFYSQTRGHEWPGGGDAYNLNDSETHDYAISCRDGEKICFGGWVTGNAKKYWGVGFSNKRGCSSCCFICGGGPIPRQILN